MQIGFLPLLTIVLVILKAMEYITWSWWWVFAPLWLGVPVVCMVAFGFCFLAAYLEKK